MIFSVTSSFIFMSSIILFISLINLVYVSLIIISSFVVYEIDNVAYRLVHHRFYIQIYNHLCAYKTELFFNTAFRTSLRHLVH
jgi:hypothetical protein